MRFYALHIANWTFGYQIRDVKLVRQSDILDAPIAGMTEYEVLSGITITLCLSINNHMSYPHFYFCDRICMEIHFDAMTLMATI